LAFLAGSEALLSLLFRLTAPSREQVYQLLYMFLNKTKKRKKKGAWLDEPKSSFCCADLGAPPDKVLKSEKENYNCRDSQF